MAIAAAAQGFRALSDVSLGWRGRFGRRSAHPGVERIGKGVTPRMFRARSSACARQFEFALQLIDTMIGHRRRRQKLCAHREHESGPLFRVGPGFLVEETATREQGRENQGGFCKQENTSVGISGHGDWTRPCGNRFA